jgi:hypothetical protein
MVDDKCSISGTAYSSGSSAGSSQSDAETHSVKISGIEKQPMHHLTVSEVEAAHPENWISWHSINKSSYSMYISAASVVVSSVNCRFFT